LKGQRPTTSPLGTLCDADDYHANLSGHVDLPFTYVGYNGVTPNCTGPTKCEWFCPLATPFYCSVTNTCIARAANCCPSGQTLCPYTGRCAADCTTCGTYAPSELKVNVDQPYIKCDPVDTTNTHFRYQISQGVSSILYTSEAFTIGTEVKHPQTFSATGSYTVTCLYGTSALARDNARIGEMTKSASCAKTIVVKPDTPDVQ